MHKDEHAVSLDLDTSTANLLSALAEKWGVSKLEAVRRALAQTTTRIDLDARPAEDAMEEQMEIVAMEIVDAIAQLTKRETYLLALHLEGVENDQIASLSAEDLNVAHLNLNNLMSKVRRFRRARSSSNAGRTAPASRLEAFAELQRRLGLTSAKAAEWQSAVHEARR